MEEDWRGGPFLKNILVSQVTSKLPTECDKLKLKFDEAYLFLSSALQYGGCYKVEPLYPMPHPYRYMCKTGNPYLAYDLHYRRYEPPHPSMDDDAAWERHNPWLAEELEND